MFLLSVVVDPDPLLEPDFNDAAIPTEIWIKIWLNTNKNRDNNNFVQKQAVTKTTRQRKILWPNIVNHPTAFPKIPLLKHGI